ncbi:MAG: serine hydrolase, partial [Chloroflexi bacterium]|nr:serine hydrolase [Chloroflexota bacterium]
MSLRTTLRRSLAAAALTSALVAAAAVAALPGSAGLGEDCARIREQAEAASVAVGVVVLDLASGERCATRAGTIFRSASLYKLLVMAEAYEQIAAGALSPGDLLDLESRHYVDVPHTDPGETVTVTVAGAIQAMIQWSDNPTAVALHELLTDAAVVGHARRLGMERTVLEPYYETTPADIALFFERLYDGTIVSARASAEMHALLRGQRIRRLLPEGLPAGVPIAHKTGSLPSWEHDAGIVEAGGGDYVIVVLTWHGGDHPAAYALIRELSALVYEGFADPQRKVESSRVPTTLVTPGPAPSPHPPAAAAAAEPTPTTRPGPAPATPTPRPAPEPRPAETQAPAPEPSPGP